MDCDELLNSGTEMAPLTRLGHETLSLLYNQHLQWDLQLAIGYQQQFSTVLDVLQIQDGRGRRRRCSWCQFDSLASHCHFLMPKLSPRVLAIHPPTWLFYWRAYTRCVSLCMSFSTGFNRLHELCTIRPDTVQPRRRRGNQRPRIPTSFTNSQLFTYV